MAGKQLGKLRQWAGEVISTREKTQPTSEFLDLERDIEHRRAGVEKLQVASTDYHYSLSRKKFSEALPGTEKMMPIDSLGIVMIDHGEEFGNESAFGNALVNFGRAHCRVAALQEAYAVTIQDTFLESLKSFISELSDYSSQRKKLESRRLAYDAAITKAEKTYKKDKDRKEADDELQKARLRYEETAEDVKTRMTAIQENELLQLKQLTDFLEQETKFVEQYLDVLRDVKAEWVDESLITKNGTSTFEVTPHQFGSRSNPDLETSRPINSNFNSMRSSHSNRSRKSVASHNTSSDQEPVSPIIEARSHGRRKSDAGAKLSRPGSRQSRKRANSNVTVGSSDGEERIDKEKSKKKGSMTGWVGDAMTSVTGRRKNRVPDKDKFTTLGDHDDIDDDDYRDVANWKRPVSSLSNRSGKSTRSKSAKESPQISPRNLKKKVKALYDFSGSADELSFKAGEEIVVVNEVLDGWWVGELDGRRGLFPTNYTEPTKGAIGKTSPPSLPSRSRNQSTHSVMGSLGLGGSNHHVDDEIKRTLVNHDSEISTDEHAPSDFDDEHPFADHHLAASRSPLTGGFYPDSATDDDGDGDVTLSIVRPADPDNKPVGLDILSVHDAYRKTVNLDEKVHEPPSPVKKAPPPPPPRRRSTTNILNVPPLPARNLASSRTQSASHIPLSSIFTDQPFMQSENHSPFESDSSLSLDTVALTKTMPGCKSCACDDFRQNPFKPQGMCSGCFHLHV
ncbi:BAR-domain-containing protein [Rickenella mellea]|uniref:BAR-domain-containing protein n=1 Tax=Rickenella mellea TaxID=50990 RepID=A0A4Y7PIP1_9AGAM|nr:BAR-domain-containing protein [Rickenella mellea]